MTRIERSYRNLCIAEGFDLLGIEMGGRHLRLRFDAGFVVAPITPSDRRNHLHVRAAIRRLHR